MNSIRKSNKTFFTIISEEEPDLTTSMEEPTIPCFCNRDIAESELLELLTNLRKKKGILHIHANVKYFKNKGYKIDSRYDHILEDTKVFKTEAGVLVAQWDRGKYYTINTKDFVKIKKINKYMYKQSLFDRLGDKIFDSSRSQKISPDQANYKTFAECLNAAFKIYNIKTCIQKIHFFTQTYFETAGFIETYEGLKNTAYEGGICFQGRGLIHTTHDFNYLKYYSETREVNFIKKIASLSEDSSAGSGRCKLVGHGPISPFNYKGAIFKDIVERETSLVNFYEKYYRYKHEKVKTVKGKKVLDGVTDYINREANNKFPDGFIEKELEPFAKKLTKNLAHACLSAGFFWEYNEINLVAKLNGSDAVTNKVNKGTDSYEKRKKLYDLFLKVFKDAKKCNYEYK